MPDKPPSPAAALPPPVEDPQPDAPRPKPNARRSYISEQLFGEHTEVEILHRDATYRLRLTALGKLILTK
jgi:hemin uptake protein HemP